MEYNEHSEPKHRTVSVLIWRHHNPPYVIHKSIFIEEKSLIVFRFLVMCFFLAIIIWMFSDMSWTYFLFLTNWGFFSGFLFFFVVNVEFFFVKNKTSILWKLAHILFEVVLTVEFCIVLFYWTALFYIDYDTHKNDSDFGTWLFNDICIHFLGFLFLWMDNIFNQIQIFKHHFIFTACFAVCYGVLNMAYTLNVQNIYPPITWVDVMSYVCVIILVVLLILHHYFTVWFYDRIKIKRIDQEITIRTYSDKNTLL